MINLNILYAKFLLNILYIKKRKNMIYANKLKNIVKIVFNNIFIIFIIFKNNIFNIQLNNIARILIFKNYVLNINKYYLNIYQKINNLKLILFKIIIIFLQYVI